MKRIIGGAAVLALLVAAMATLIDLSGVVVGPFLMLALGAGASWWAAHWAGAHLRNREVYAGMLAGAAAGVGALTGVLLVLALSSWIMVAVPQMNTAMVQFVAHGGVLIGVLLALTDLIFTLSGGFFGLLMYERRHAMWHAPR